MKEEEEENKERGQRRERQEEQEEIKYDIPFRFDPIHLYWYVQKIFILFKGQIAPS